MEDIQQQAMRRVLAVKGRSGSDTVLKHGRVKVRFTLLLQKYNKHQPRAISGPSE
jgi:hypothetical protein